jgi:hypothetical protein
VDQLTETAATGDFLKVLEHEASSLQEINSSCMPGEEHGFTAIVGERFACAVIRNGATLEL